MVTRLGAITHFVVNDLSSTIASSSPIELGGVSETVMGITYI